MKTEQQQQSGLQLSPSATVALNELIDYCLGDEINHYAECITDGEDVDNLADCEPNEGHIPNIPNSIIELQNALLGLSRTATDVMHELDEGF